MSMTAHCRLSAASAPRSLSCTPSILGELYTRANDARGMNSIGCFNTRSPASTSVMATTSTRSIEVIKSPNNEPEPELHSAKATASSLAIGSLYQSSFELATIGYWFFMDLLLRSFHRFLNFLTKFLLRVLIATICAMMVIDHSCISSNFKGPGFVSDDIFPTVYSLDHTNATASIPTYACGDFPTHACGAPHLYASLIAAAEMDRVRYTSNPPYTVNPLDTPTTQESISRGGRYSRVRILNPAQSILYPVVNAMNQPFQVEVGIADKDNKCWLTASTVGTISIHSNLDSSNAQGWTSTSQVLPHTCQEDPTPSTIPSTTGNHAGSIVFDFKEGGGDCGHLYLYLTRGGAVREFRRGWG